MWRSQTSQQISKRRNEPKTLDAIGGTNLIFVKIQLVLTVTEINFNLPTHDVKIQNIFIESKVGIGTNKSTKHFFLSEHIDRITDQNHSILNVIEFAFITINIVFPPFHGDDVKERNTIKCLYKRTDIHFQAIEI